MVKVSKINEGFCEEMIRLTNNKYNSKLTGWKSKFSEMINKELKSYKLDSDRRPICIIKDVIYLLGISIDKNKYSCKKGFELFCKDMKIKL